VILDFVRATNDTDKRSTVSTSYGKARIIDRKTYVQLDGGGSRDDQLLPVTTTAELREGERVLVEIDKHTAIAYGNTSSPAARVGTVTEVNNKVLRVDTVVAHELLASDITAVNGYISHIVSNTIDTGKLTADEIKAIEVDIETLRSAYIESKQISVDEMTALNATIANLEATVAKCTTLDAENLEAVNANIQKLQSKNAEIENLSVKDAFIKYANIDFSRIGKAVLEELYSRSGLIENATISDGYITGRLVGVTIKGDLIEGGTIVADKLVIKGDDGLYYKLNTFGVDRNGLTHGIEYIETDMEVDCVEYIETDVEADDAYYVEKDAEIELNITGEKTGDTTINGNPVYVVVEDGTLYTIIDGKYIGVKTCLMTTLDTPVKTINGNAVYVFGDDLNPHYVTRVEGVAYLVECRIKGSVASNILTNQGNEVYRSDGTEDPQYFTIRDYKTYLVTAELVELNAEQTEYNSLNGSIITAKSIVAEQIRTDDLIAFDATIGGFVIDGNPTDEGGVGSIHTVGKSTVDNDTIQGIYMDSLGQMNIGDDRNFIKYVRNEDGTYSLGISAKTIEFALSNGETRSLSSLGDIGEYIRITTYKDPVTNKEEPCIELGEGDSDFKLYITNTRILFADGDAYPARITNQALYIDKAVIEDELRFGQFVWKKRDNGNMGIVWSDEEVTD
jgi:hypothetical protein